MGLLFIQLQLIEYDYKWNKDIVVNYVGDYQGDTIFKNKLSLL